MTKQEYILTLGCPDAKGIVHAVSEFLLAQNCNINQSNQFETARSDQFYMRVAFSASDENGMSRSEHLLDLQNKFSNLADTWNMEWRMVDACVKAKAILFVSKFDHCLVDLLYRIRIGELALEIPAIISNHKASAALAAEHGIDFHHLPITKATKPAQEAKIMDVIASHQPDFIVLARYMQILSDGLCAALPCPAINIHHSFLPGFKGAKPYHQAFDRGVKLIGATAHYVTPDLDEGPIIAQDVTPINHAQGPDELVAIGRDIERRVLSRAVRLQAEQRIMRNGDKTIIFE